MKKREGTLDLRKSAETIAFVFWKFMQVRKAKYYFIYNKRKKKRHSLRLAANTLKNSYRHFLKINFINFFDMKSYEEIIEKISCG